MVALHLEKDTKQLRSQLMSSPPSHPFFIVSPTNKLKTSSAVGEGSPTDSASAFKLFTDLLIIGPASTATNAGNFPGI